MLEIRAHNIQMVRLQGAGWQLMEIVDSGAGELLDVEPQRSLGP